MPRSQMLKIDMEARLHKLKTELYEMENQTGKTGQWCDGAHYAYNEVLKVLQEYRV
tara:strand:+ start:439 stop:606 length:168 start_codon:yes stop_codon:yes gene_type:complete